MGMIINSIKCIFAHSSRQYNCHHNIYSLRLLPNKEFVMINCDPLTISETLTTRIKKDAFLTTVKAGDSMNTMTIGWALIGFIWKRTVFMVTVRNSRHKFSIMEKAVDFTVTVPDGSMKDALMFCGSNSGRDLDKFKACNLTPVAAH
jgi:hypothetical protein